MSFNSMKLGLAVAISAALTACGGAGSNNSSDNTPAKSNNQASVAMQFDMSAFLSQNLSSANFSAMATADQVLRGELSATAIGGDNNGQVQTFTWTISLDETTFEATSNSTLVLEPGNYDFELLLTRGDQQYAGYANSTLADGENDVAMTIEPVIGSAVSDVTIIDQLAHFKFQYPEADLATLADPSLGIQVDADNEEVFAVNPTTGMTEAFVNLPVGNHHVELKLYNASVQVGKSVDAQEDVLVTLGTDLRMDLVPLHSELQFQLTENGGDANLTVTLPSEILDEVGGLENLVANLQLVGTQNPLQETELFFSEQADGSVQAEVVLQDLQFENVTISMSFADKTTGDKVGSCNNSWSLNSNNQAFDCGVTLVRRAVVSGNILSVVGVNVLNEAGLPVEGVVISDATGILAVTGAGTYGTPGYAKLYLTSGTHTLKALDLTTGQVSEVEVTVSALDVDNILMTLADPVPTGFVASDWTYTGVAAYSASESGFTVSVGSGGGGKTAATTMAASGTIDFDWSITVYAAGQYGDVIKYSVNGVETVLSSAGSRSGHATINVNTGDRVTLDTWGTTRSSSYSASFSNYKFTAK